MVAEETKIRKSSSDSVNGLLKLFERARRKTSRLDSFGVLPEEVSVKVLGHILSIREELLALER